MNTYLDFASNHPLLVSALFFSLLLVLFTELRRKAAGMINIEPAQAVMLINKDAAVIDVRSADAFASGHIVNAKNVPMDELDAHMDKLENLKDKPVVTICQAGITSTKAVDALRKLGFENVYGIKGGMGAWTEAGLPVVSAKKVSGKKPKKKK
jgi:rhodanese-related sulfurtransferase